MRPPSRACGVEASSGCGGASATLFGFFKVCVGWRELATGQFGHDVRERLCAQIQLVGLSILGGIMADA